VSIALARTRPVYDLVDVQDALERSRGRSPELDAFYERMLETGPERFVTTPSSLDALDPLRDECPNFDEVLDDLARYLRLAHAGNRGFNLMPILLLGGPGVGKTHFARRLARAMGTEFELIGMNALSAGFVITGSSASWRGAKWLGLALLAPVRLRKKVTWKPSGRLSGVSTQPVTYHHSVRKSGWGP